MASTRISSLRDGFRWDRKAKTARHFAGRCPRRFALLRALFEAQEHHAAMLLFRCHLRHALRSGSCSRRWISLSEERPPDQRRRFHEEGHCQMRPAGNARGSDCLWVHRGRRLPELQDWRTVDVRLWTLLPYRNSELPWTDVGQSKGGLLRQVASTLVLRPPSSR